MLHHSNLPVACLGWNMFVECLHSHFLLAPFREENSAPTPFTQHICNVWWRQRLDGDLDHLPRPWQIADTAIRAAGPHCGPAAFGRVVITLPEQGRLRCMCCDPSSSLGRPWRGFSPTHSVVRVPSPHPNLVHRSCWSSKWKLLRHCNLGCRARCGPLLPRESRRRNCLGLHCWLRPGATLSCRNARFPRRWQLANADSETQLHLARARAR
mmetsp:Transcript_107099/g.245152  ORF Transcript_107099/g.245152 Transcript_107099/m.245152 type:complete len:211 (-) Transcript_107099:1045-1677(-)